MTALRRAESELEQFLRRHNVSAREAYLLGAGEPCPDCGRERREEAARADGPLRAITRVRDAGIRGY